MKILIISPHFPTPDVYSNLVNDPRSKFLLRYALSWTRSGCAVTVLHTPPKYPLAFKTITKLAKLLRVLGRFNLGRFVQNKNALVTKSYDYQGISIHRKGVLKIFPGSDFFGGQLKNVVKFFKKEISSHNFDIVICDYLSPSIKIADLLGLIESSNVFAILHQTDIKYFHNNKHLYVNYLKSLNGVLFRSKTIQKAFVQEVTSLKSQDILLSGVPDEIKFGKPRESVRKFLYVGTLRKSKNIHNILFAFQKVRDQFLKNITLDIVGDGEYYEDLVALTNKLGIQDNVTFLGRRNHKEVFEIMRESDVFVMVSKETFGMVYVEAMSQGCIAIGAEGEGIDGVIVNNQNGFLTPLNDVNRLENLLLKILRLPTKDIVSISSQAISTSKQLTDSELANSILCYFRKNM